MGVVLNCKAAPDLKTKNPIMRFANNETRSTIVQGFKIDQCLPNLNATIYINGMCVFDDNTLMLCYAANATGD
jgi:hypothetical protein